MWQNWRQASSYVYTYMQNSYTYSNGYFSTFTWTNPRALKTTVKTITNSVYELIYFHKILINISTETQTTKSK